MNNDIYDQNLIKIMTSNHGTEYIEKMQTKNKKDLADVVKAFPCELHNIAEHISNYIQFISNVYATKTTTISVSLAYYTLSKIKNDAFYFELLNAIQFAPDPYKSNACNHLACRALKMYLSIG